MVSVRDTIVLDDRILLYKECRSTLKIARRSFLIFDCPLSSSSLSPSYFYLNLTFLSQVQENLCFFCLRYQPCISYHHAYDNVCSENVPTRRMSAYIGNSHWQVMSVIYGSLPVYSHWFRKWKDLCECCNNFVIMEQ